MPASVSVFVLPPSLEVLEQRLRGRRQDDAAAIARRLAAARDEIGHVGEFDYVIINKDFDRAAAKLATIVRAERLRGERQLARHADLIDRLK
jgi:guanylate kinase